MLKHYRVTDILNINLMKNNNNRKKEKTNNRTNSSYKLM